MSRSIKKNIVIAPCGNKSFLFQKSWLQDSENKEFDLCLLFYHENINDPTLYEKADFFFHLKDFKYKMLYNLFTNIHPEWLNEYEYFYFLDDDIDIDTENINQMFALSKAFKTNISQASLSLDSFCSWPMFKQNKNCFLRYVGQIEVMAPLFDQESLKKCLPTFIATLSSWGLDSVWSKLLDYTEDKLVVFDTIVMKHTLPVGGGELYVKLKVDPYKEWHDVTAEYGAKLQNYREYGRLKMLHVKTSNTFKIANYFTENYTLLKRKFKDYNLTSRLKFTK